MEIETPQHGNSEKCTENLLENTNHYEDHTKESNDYSKDSGDKTKNFKDEGMRESRDDTTEDNRSGSEKQTQKEDPERGARKSYLMAMQ